MNNQSSNKKYKTGLVLSGGGARGFSHLGAVKALLEEGYQFDIIAGTSMGAIIGSILADGYHPDEVVQLLTSDRLKTFVKTHITTNSFMSIQGGMDFITEILRAKNIEDLKIPFIAAATDICKGQTRYFNKGNIIKAISASASIPVIFAPVEINERHYVDGGVLNNLPVRSIRENCDKIIGIHVNPQSLGLHNGDVKGIAQIAERAFHLCMLGNVLPDKHECDLFIEHSNLDGYTAFDFVKMQEIVDIGYKNTKEMLQKKALTL